MADFFKKMGSTFENLKKHKMNALTHLDVPETPDDDFVSAAAAFEAVKGSISTLEKLATEYHRQLQTFSTSMETLTQSFGAAMTDDTGDAPLCDVAAATQVVFDFRNATKESSVDAFEANVLTPLREKTSQIEKVTQAIKDRVALKQEYDYYYEKVRKLREKGSDSAKDQVKLERNEPKLQTAKVALQEASTPLIAFFEQCKAVRRKVVAHEYEQFKKCQSAFLGTAVEKFSTLADSSSDFELITLPDLGTCTDSTDAGGGEKTGSEATEEAAESSAAGDATPAATDDAAEATAEATSEPKEADKPADDSKGAPAVALFDFEPNAEDELKLTVGQELVVLVQNDGGWWEGEADGKVGLFPASYVKLKT